MALGGQGAAGEGQFPDGLQRSESSPVSEADVMVLWWERVVGRAGDRARQQALLELGEQALTTRRANVSISTLDAQVLRSLENDQILSRDASRDAYAFSHDIVEEWLATRVLATHDNPIAHLEEIGRPYWISGSVELLACWRLEQGELETWRTLLKDASEAPASGASTEKVERGVRGYWADAIIAAPLRSTRTDQILALIGDDLLANDGRVAVNLLRVMRTRFIRPNPALRSALQSFQISDGHRDALLLEMGIPVIPVWLPVLRWLVPRLRDLPWQAKEEASRVMLAWQRLPVPNLRFKREIATAALEWWSVLIHPSGERVIVDRKAVPFFDRLRDIVLLSADVIGDQIAGFEQHTLGPVWGRTGTFRATAVEPCTF